MNPFGTYASYYDLLYHDKDYAAEARFVHALIERHAPGARTVLDLGCGTGRHALELAALGYTVHGVDRSPEMLAVAKERRAGSDNAQRERLTFGLGDVRDLRLGRTFDAVVALFHVMSYQTTDADLGATIATARAHLPAGGLFVFDFWHGPAVLQYRPQARIRQVEDAEVNITRRGEPVWDQARNLVHVHYHLSALSRSGAKVQLREVHSLRYFFETELEQFLNPEGLTIEVSASWMTEVPLGPEVWSAYAVVRATEKAPE